MKGGERRGELPTLRRKLAYETTEQSSGIQSRDNNPTGDFAAKGYDRKDQLDGCPVDEPSIVLSLVFECFLCTDPRS